MANKTKSNLGIKQGDKVRVSKDAPKLIFGSCDMSQIVCTVCCVDKDVAAINMINDERIEMKVWIVPTKYLVKVDAEAKEPTAPAIKVGDNVRNIITGEVGRVLDIQRHVAKVDVVCDWKDRYWDLNNIEVFVPKAEECHYIPTEAEKKPNIGSIKIPVEVDLTDSYWDAYAAELAKELSVVYAKQGIDPIEAVGKAKEIIKQLKQNK